MVNDETLAKYEMTAGIECHVQLATKTKLFSGVDNDERNKQPNQVVSPIDFALPGMLPVLNRSAIDLAIRAAKALNSSVAPISRFDRKHYFYPDLPKGYQISQMYQPIIGPGLIEVPMEDGQSFKVRINHAHLEEDAGKLTHFKDYSLVDLNRAGTPLIEIVSEPDIHSPFEAKAYANELYRLMTYAGVTRGDLYHGNMRFDVNVSVALKGSKELGTRTETKNLNSFKSVERAADFEFRRQVEVIEKGQKVIQETRGWDDSKQKTTAQRGKEDAQDYRYMPDPDIPPIILEESEILKIQSKVPNLPPFYRQSWGGLGLDATVVNAILLNRINAEKLQRIYQQTNKDVARRVAIWLAKITSKQSQDEGDAIQLDVSDEQLIELSNMVQASELNSNAADEILLAMIDRDDSPRTIALERNLLQISDDTLVSKIVNEVLDSPVCQQAILDFKAGNQKVLGFLVGQVMQASKGKANPGLAQRIIKERLK